MLLACYRHAGAEGGLELFELGAAEPLARLGGSTDRATVFDQQETAVLLLLVLGHVALAAPLYPFRTADLARLVFELDQPLPVQLSEMLPDADFGDAEGAREGARAHRTPRLEHVEDPISAVRRQLFSRP